MTALVDSSIATWLKDGDLKHIAEKSAIASSWGDLATDSDIASPYANRSDAAIANSEQLNFLGQPLALERLRIHGYHADMAGTSRRLSADRVGYAASPLVYILGAQEAGDGMTELLVLRPMQPEVQT